MLEYLIVISITNLSRPRIYFRVTYIVENIVIFISTFCALVGVFLKSFLFLYPRVTFQSIALRTRPIEIYSVAVTKVRVFVNYRTWFSLNTSVRLNSRLFPSLSVTKQNSKKSQYVFFLYI